MFFRIGWSEDSGAAFSCVLTIKGLNLLQERTMDQDLRWIQRFGSFQKALAQLREAVSLVPGENL